MKIVDLNVRCVAKSLTCQLCHNTGVHPGFFLRTVFKLITDEGIVGLGEGDQRGTLTKLKPRIVGMSPFHLEAIKLKVLRSIYYLSNAATKCAQTSLVKNLARQLAPDGITLNNLAPGAIETDRNSERLADDTYGKTVESWIPAGRIGRAEDCAGAALFLCSDAASYVTGQNLYADGGMGL